MSWTILINIYVDGGMRHIFDQNDIHQKRKIMMNVEHTQKKMYGY